MSPKRSKYKKLLLMLYWLIPVVFLVGVGAGFLLRAATASPVAQEPDDVQRYVIQVEGEPSIGPANAPITIVEFGDYQCGYCRKWHDEVFGPLMNAYAGKIRFVFKDFPLAQQTVPTLAAANCAGKQGKYWEYHSALFAGQYGFDMQGFTQLAASLGMNTQTFTTCVDSDQILQEIYADQEEASGIGVRSTPTFFINGIAIIGAQPLSAFQSIIDSELKK